MLLYPTSTNDLNAHHHPHPPTRSSTRSPKPFIHYNQPTMPSTTLHTTKAAPLRISPSQPTQPQTHTLDPFTARTDSQRWSLLSTRSVAHTPVPPFIYGVTSTKIYCRPTCPARLARRANVLFFDTAAEAANAGFRACRRCRPDVVVSAGESAGRKGERRKAAVSAVDGGGADAVSGAAAAAAADLRSDDTPTATPTATAPAIDDDDADEEEAYIAPGDGEEGRRKVVHAVQIIKQRAERGEKVSLAELGREVGLSKWHLLRVFRKRWGVSPREMGDGVLLARTKTAGGDGQRVKTGRGKRVGLATMDRAGGGVGREDEGSAAANDRDLDENVSATASNSTTNTATESSGTTPSISTPSTGTDLLEFDYGCYNGYGADPMLTFEESLLNFEAMDLDHLDHIDMDAPLFSELWGGGGGDEDGAGVGAKGDDVIKDLFPEVYVQRSR